jgi:hypothetical protein
VLSPVSFKLAFPATYIAPWLRKISTAAFQRAVVNAIPWKTLHQTRDMVDLMHQTSVEIMEKKMHALASEGEEAMKQLTAEGKDMMSILRASSLVMLTRELMCHYLISQRKHKEPGRG